MGECNSRRIMLKELLDNGEFVNGMIRTEDGGTFKIHLEVLASRSPYIRRIIKEMATDTPVDNLLIPGASRDVVANIINFVYTGELCLSLDKVRVLAKTGEFLGISEIIEMCEKFLVSKLNDKSCFMIYKLVRKMINEYLEKEAVFYIATRFQQIFPVSSDFLHLEPGYLLPILKSDNLNVKTEEDVFWAGIKWIEKDTAKRLDHLPDLLRCIRFGFCSFELIENNIWKHPYVLSNDECQSIRTEVSLLYEDLQLTNDTKCTQSMICDIDHPFLRPRIPNEIIFVMGGWGVDMATNLTETYDVNSNRWFLSVHADAIPRARAYHGMLWHKGYIYVIGGFDGRQFFNTLKRYDPVTHTWEEKGCMHAKRGYVSVAAVGDYIYAMGGFDGYHRKQSCERYDPETNQWKMRARMLGIRSDAGTAVLQDKIYIAGGFNGINILRSVERFNPKANVWTAISDMQIPRSALRLAAYKNCIYAIGGFNGADRLCSVEKYDGGAWNSAPDMQQRRSNFGVAIFQECLYVMGGYNGDSTIAAAEYFDDCTNKWTSFKDLNLNRSGLAACTVKNIRNAQDYTYLGNVPQSSNDNEDINLFAC